MREPVVITDLVFLEGRQMDLGVKLKLKEFFTRKNLKVEYETFLYRSVCEKLGILRNTKYESFFSELKLRNTKIDRSNKWDLFIVNGIDEISSSSDTICVSDKDDNVPIQALDGRIILCNNSICVDFLTDKTISMFRGLDL